MTIDLAAAEQYGNLTVFGFGMGLVFIGLICIIAICAIMGSICKRLIKDKPVTAGTASASTTPVKAEIANKGEFVAAIAAAIAEDVGTSVEGIKILSIKQI